MSELKAFNYVSPEFKGRNICISNIVECVSRHDKYLNHMVYKASDRELMVSILGEKTQAIISGNSDALNVCVISPKAEDVEKELRALFVPKDAVCLTA